MEAEAQRDRGAQPAQSPESAEYNPLSRPEIKIEDNNRRIQYRVNSILEQVDQRFQMMVIHDGQLPLDETILVGEPTEKEKELQIKLDEKRNSEEYSWSQEQFETWLEQDIRRHQAKRARRVMLGRDRVLKVSIPDEWDYCNNYSPSRIRYPKDCEERFTYDLNTGKSLIRMDAYSGAPWRSIEDTLRQEDNPEGNPGCGVLTIGGLIGAGLGGLALYHGLWDASIYTALCGGFFVGGIITAFIRGSRTDKRIEKMMEKNDLVRLYEQNPRGGWQLERALKTFSGLPDYLEQAIARRPERIAEEAKREERRQHTKIMQEVREGSRFLERLREM